MKKGNLAILLLSLAVLAAALVFFLHDSGQSKPTIAFVGYSTTQPFWIALRNAAEEQAKKNGYTFLDLTSVEPDAERQKAAVDNAIAKKVSGIIIGAVDNRAFEDSLDRARTANIPVVTVDTAISNDWVASLVQTDNLSAAKIAGKYIAGKIKAGKVLILGGTAGHQTGEARKEGVTSEVEKAGFKTIFRACDWLEDKAYETTLNELTSNPDISAIFAASDPMALSAISALKQKGKLGKLIVVGFDGNPANLKAILAGEQDADIKQDNIKMGKEAVNNLVKIIKGEKAEKFIPIEGILITKDNVEKFIAK
jgi:ribose transport system substrate-binding protein